MKFNASSYIMKSNDLHVFESEDWKTIESQFTKFYRPTFEFVTENKGTVEEAKDIYISAFVYYTQLIEIQGVKLFDKADQIIYSFSRRLWLHKLEKRRVDLNYVRHKREYFEMEEAFYEIDSISQRSAKTAGRLADIGEPCRTIVLEYVGRRKPLMECASRLGFANEDRAFQQVTKCIRKLIGLTENVEIKQDDATFTGLVRYVLDDMDRESSPLMEKDKVVIAMISRAVAMVRNYVNSSERTQVLKDIQDKMMPSMLESALMKPKNSSNHKKMKPISMIAATATLAVVVSAITAFSVAGSMHANGQPIEEKVAKPSIELGEEMAEVLPEVAPTSAFVGTAFAISNDGYFLTASSAIKDAAKVQFVNPSDGQSMEAAVVHVDAANDLALLRISGEMASSIVPYRFSPDGAKIGEEVYSLGFPEESIFYSNGSLHSVNSQTGQIGLKSASAGAPVISSNGQIVGMINGTKGVVSDTPDMVKVEQISKMLKEIAADRSIQVNVPQKNKLFYSDRTRQIEQVSPFLFRVEVFYQ
jgi:S1-C subfamily serine protease